MSDSSPAPSRNSAEDVRAIVSFLKQPPFSRSHTLVSFSQLSPLELLQLTNDIFASLDPKQSRDLRDEPSDVTTHRMIDYLITTLSYQPPSLPSSSSYTSDQLADFGSSFISASPATVYPILLYTLSNYPTLQKRAYLSQYLSIPSLPPDILSDPTIASLLSSLQHHQDEFKALHQQTETVREGAMHASGLKKEVDQLESEREQLKAKMKRLAQKVEMEEEGKGGGSFSSMLKLTNLLRLEQEEEHKLMQQREDQKMRLDELKQDLTHLTHQYDQQCKYHGVGKGEGGVNPGQLLARMKAEVKEEAEVVERVLEVELIDKEKTLKHLMKQSEAVGNDQYGEDEVDDMRAKVSDLERQVKKMEQEKERMIGGAESQLGFLYDRLSAVQKKKEKTEAKLKEVEDEVSEARLEKEKLEAEVDLLTRQQSTDERDGVPRGGKELKRYMEQLTVKTSQYKELKNQLDVMTAELQVLESTFQTLKGRVHNQQELNLQLEKVQGVEGWGNAEGQLVDLAVQGRRLDEEKAETLEEISALVERIDAQIKAKKNVLAPSIKELRGVRGVYEGVEVEWRTGKEQHEKLGLRYESERLKLETEVREREEEKEKVERTRWRSTMEEKILKVREEQLRDRAGVKQYEAEVDRLTKALEKKEKVLKKEKKQMNDNGNAYVNQRHLFKNLELILKVKEEGMGGKAGVRVVKDRMEF